MSKKRPNPLMAEEIFRSMSSKADLYKHLDQHLQVSIYFINPNFAVLCMSLRHVYQGLCQRDISRAEITDKEKRHPVHRRYKVR